MITEGEAAILLETTRRAFRNQSQSKQRSTLSSFIFHRVTESYSEKFILGLPHMRHLVHFSLKYDCTGSVLQVLAETCRKTLRILGMVSNNTVWVRRNRTFLVYYAYY